MQFHPGISVVAVVIAVQVSNSSPQREREGGRPLILAWE